MGQEIRAGRCDRIVPSSPSGRSGASSRAGSSCPAWPLLLPDQWGPLVRVRRLRAVRRRGRGLRHPPQRSPATGRLAALRPRPRRCSRPATWSSTSPSAPSVGPTAIPSPTSCTSPRTRCSRSRSSTWRGRGSTARPCIDSAIVAVALSAVIWQWVITPVVESTNGSTLERMVTVAYPLMDILLVVVIVHAVFTLPRWSAAAWLLFAGLGVDAGRRRGVRASRRRRNLLRRRRARRRVADRILPARGRGHAPVDACTLGRRRRRAHPSRARPHVRARCRAVRRARGRAPRRHGIEHRGRARGDHRHRRARRRLAHHPPGRRVEPRPGRAR